MTFFETVRSIYSLDTLDARLTTSSNTPSRTSEASIEGTKSPAQQALQNGKNTTASNAQPSKWNTKEFYFYYLCFLTIPFVMAKSVYDVSKESHPNYPKYSHLLSDGWIPGRKVDNSDGQYSSVRDNMPYMLLLTVLHPVLRRAYNKFWRIDSYTRVPSGRSRNTGLTMGLSPSAAADARLEHRVSFDVGFAAVYLVALYGVSALKVYAIVYLNYKIATKLPRSYVPAATWIFNMSILFTNKLYNGYPLANIAMSVAPGSSLVQLAESIDSFKGLVGRWEILFNISVLRLISFNLDYYWSLKQTGSDSIEKQLDPANLSERDRVTISAKPADYTFRKYLAYTLYSPLYLAGPILTFNDYISQSRCSLASVDLKRTLLYGVRFLVCLLTMEVMQHYLYAVAISNSNPDWRQYSPMQLSMLGYFYLHHIWLKLLIPWRLFRLWSLLDGIDPPENMIRCMSDNYSALAFWRAWHRSFNRWLIRYVYVPIGGSGQSQVRVIANLLVVFTFVALWHDISGQLLVWSWLIVFFVLPEVMCTLAFPAKKWKDRPEAYRMLCGVGAVGNIMMMMVANLIGFAIGTEGTKNLVRGIVGSWGGGFFVLAACATLFVGVQVMFEVRESEKRKGINLKC
ncbi:hypothetical protein AAFC00_005923 [Neodothiora populina]|uniref:Glycerol transporter n=1 Tax=Neodothiora populina TaxID=2781224 RepID=A0ABR3P6N4_9PEZI